MLDNSVLKVQDQLLQITQDARGMIEFSFEEFEDDGQKPTHLLSRFYEQNYFSQDSGRFSLTEMLIDLDNDSSGWLGLVRSIFEKYNVSGESSEVWQTLSNMFMTETKVWLVSPQKKQEYVVTQDSLENEPEVETEISFDSMAENIPPMGENWKDFLFLKEGRYFLLHLGFTNQA